MSQELQQITEAVSSLVKRAAEGQAREVADSIQEGINTLTVALGDLIATLEQRQKGGLGGFEQLTKAIQGLRLDVRVPDVHVEPRIEVQVPRQEPPTVRVDTAPVVNHFAPLFEPRMEVTLKPSETVFEIDLKTGFGGMPTGMTIRRISK